MAKRKGANRKFMKYVGSINGRAELSSRLFSVVVEESVVEGSTPRRKHTVWRLAKR
jgi:hypothetical protein